jgi:glycosyltransferase involved in cell wall biosynthesis
MKNKTAVICLSKVNGGMELASVKLARLLSEDMDIDFIARDGGFIARDSKKHFQDCNIKLHKVAFLSNFSFKLIFDIRKIIKQSNIKNIIFLGASEMKSLYFSCLGLDINFIIRQGSKKSTPKRDFLHRLFYSNVKYFVGNSEYIKENIKQIFPIPVTAKLLRIYSSLKIDSKISQHVLQNPIKIVIVGRVHPNKGQLDAVKAFEILEKNHISFSVDILGDIQHKEYYNEIKQFLSTTRYEDKINFIGYTSDVKRYLLDADIFVLSSLGEGMSNAIIEALGYGLVTLIYNDTSSPEFKNLGFYLHLTGENRVDVLKDELLSICENVECEKQISMKNIELAQNIFSPGREKRDYMELLV